jgi:hypothetical protein
LVGWWEKVEGGKAKSPKKKDWAGANAAAGAPYALGRGGQRLKRDCHWPAPGSCDPTPG